jgi:amino acid adenylation domain-containing protein
MTGSGPFIYRQQNFRKQVADDQRNNYSFQISDAAGSRVLGMTNGNDAGIFNCVLTAVGIVLSRYSGQANIVLDTALLGDAAEEVSDKVLPLSFAADPGSTIRVYLNEVQETIGNSYMNEDSLAHQADSGIQQTNVFIHYSAIQAAAPDLQEYDLVFNLERSESAITISIDYKASYFDARFIARMQQHLEAVFSGYADLDELTGDIDILSAEERATIFRFNGSHVAYPKDKTVIELFEEQVKRTPSALAVVADDGSLTYEELDNSSNKLAKYLREQSDVKPGDIVGIMSKRSSRLITGIVGALKAGAAYLPIDPNYPKERQKHMLTEAEVKVLLVDSEYMFGVDFFEGELFMLDMQLEMLEEGYASATGTTGQDVAYVIYTSGSTGTPKGVMVKHASLINLCNWHCREFEVTMDSRATMYANIAFDASVWELWPYLLAGATLYPVNEELKLDLTGLVDFFNDNQITHCFLPTPICSELIGRKLPVSSDLLILTGGDELRNAEASALNIVNNYGPTESTVVATSIKLRDNAHAPLLPIGKPIDNIQVFILDNEQRIVPVGVEGELFIAGEGLAKGYLRRQDLTDEKFVQSPVPGVEGVVYGTGDIACWLEDGNILFKGRKDSQVKIRGYRIELGDIAAQLRKHNAIDDVLVLLKEEDKNKYLCAYYTAKQEIKADEFRKFLHRSLPDYMVPSYFFFLQQFPLTTNAKIDTKALLQLSTPRETAIITGSPKDILEERMSRVWQDALSVKAVGVKDNFFALGGDSIKALRLVYDVNEAFGSGLKLMDIFKFDTPEKLLARIKETQGSVDHIVLAQEVDKLLETEKSAYLQQHAISGLIEDIYPVADIQLGMLYHGLYGEKGRAVYHDQILHQVKYPNFDPVRLGKAVQLMSVQHEILRTGFDISDMDAPVQIVYKSIEADYVHEDLSRQSRQEQEAIIKQRLADDRAQPFDIQKPGLWRVRTYSLGNNVVVVLLVCHHAIIDGWSDATFSTELNNLYVRLKDDPAFAPAKLSCSYKDYVRDEILAKRNPAVKKFWKNEFAGYQKTKFIFELDDAHSKNKVYNKDLGNDLKEKLAKFSVEHNLSPRTVCFSVFLQMIRSLSLSEELITGLHSHNRPVHKESEKMLGCFLNTLPVKYRFSEDMTWMDHLAAANNKVLEVSGNSNLSLFEIAKLNPQQGKSNENPFFDTLFAYLDFHVYQELDADNNEFASTFGRNELDVHGQGINNTHFNVLVNATLDEFNLLVFYKSTQIDAELVAHIAETFREGLLNLIERPTSIIEFTNQQEETLPVSNETNISFNF